jgi:drug/metabolite transporter (DMT)-like permease
VSIRAASLTRVALLALIWGSGFLWIELSLRGFTPVQLTLGRLALGALALALILWRGRIRTPFERNLWGHLIVAALLANAIPYLLFGIGQQYVASNLAGAINATTPLWTLAIAYATRTERSITTIRVGGLLLGFTVGLLILSPWQTAGTSLGGALACLAASASYGASFVYMGRYLTNRGLSPLVLSAAQLVAATGWLTLASPFGGFDSPEWRTDAVIALFILGAIGTGAAYVLNYRIITDDGPILASTVTYLLPVVAVILGWLALGERITGQMAAGVAVVLLGVALSRRAGRTQVRGASPATKYVLGRPRRRRGSRYYRN